MLLTNVRYHASVNVFVSTAGSNPITILYLKMEYEQEKWFHSSTVTIPNQRKTCVYYAHLILQCVIFFLLVYLSWHKSVTNRTRRAGFFQMESSEENLLMETYGANTILLFSCTFCLVFTTRWIYPISPDVLFISSSFFRFIIFRDRTKKRITYKKDIPQNLEAKRDETTVLPLKPYPKQRKKKQYTSVMLNLKKLMLHMPLHAIKWSIEWR